MLIRGKIADAWTGRQGVAVTVQGLVRQERLEALRQRVADNPFLTDEELSNLFGVSIQTVRLDRLALGIPEMRQRTREMARRAWGLVRAVVQGEVMGELVDLELGRRALSILETSEEMAFSRTGVVRGHYLFAQAESLALAVIDAPSARAGLANAKFRRPVRAGERLVAKAEVLRSARENGFVVLVVTRSGQEQVFRAKFMVLAGQAEGKA